MKSIKEKAEEYGYTNWQSDEYHDGASEGLEFDAIGHTQKTFEAGANYVLDVVEKEIKRLFLEDYEEFSEEDRQIAQGVLGRINIWLKQFKGE